MDSIELAASPKALNYFFGSLLYIPACLFVFRLLFPRLTADAKRLALLTLVAQVAVIVVSLEAKPTSAMEEWLWDIDKEWNIPSAIASTLVALIGFAALLTFWASRVIPRRQRLWLVAIGLVFMILGLEEFLDTKYANLDWPLYYAAVGIVLAGATIAVARRSPRHQRLWYICLFCGLALMAIGVFLIDELPLNCGAFAFLKLDGCLNYQTVEELLELIGSWLALVAMLGFLSDAVPNPKPVYRCCLFAFPALWLLLMALVSPISSFRFSLQAQPTAVEFESGARLYGYEADRKGMPIAGYFYFSEDMIAAKTGFSIHLVDQVSGDSIASQNRWASREQAFFLSGKSYLRVYYQLLRVLIPPDAPANRALWVVLTLWRKDDDSFAPIKILSSDQRLLSDTQVVLGELVLRAESESSPTDTVAIFDQAFRLGAVDLPERANADGLLPITFRWSADADGAEDFTQFLHFAHDESRAQWGYDQRPLGPRLPTRLWYSGLADSETWAVPLPADLARGTYNVYTGLYRIRDQERLPASDAEGKPYLDARVPLGYLIIEG
ncbi:MAG: hypothetical protein OXG84_02065 [Chloroflexi bacterium]|nr:hypothetical protein [Chloroflexota bacterium]